VEQQRQTVIKTPPTWLPLAWEIIQAKNSFNGHFQSEPWHSRCPLNPERLTNATIPVWPPALHDVKQGNHSSLVVRHPFFSHRLLRGGILLPSKRLSNSSTIFQHIVHNNHNVDNDGNDRVAACPDAQQTLSPSDSFY